MQLFPVILLGQRRNCTERIQPTKSSDKRLKKKIIRKLVKEKKNRKLVKEKLR